MQRRPAAPPAPDLSEKGSPRNGQPQRSDRRLFMQLLVYTGVADPAPLVTALTQAQVEGTLYADLNDARGIALLTISETPDFFVGPLRQLLNRAPFAQLTPRPELTMFGRTYSLGYEPDLEDTLFGRPRRTALNPDWPWVVWYPLRRKGEFAQLPAFEQRSILMEHGVIGRAFGEADLAHDVRLVCHGLDTHDNDFVVGLMGKELHPLSAIVQTMRSTRQTSQFLERLGPFFIGKALWQSALPPSPAQQQQ